MHEAENVDRFQPIGTRIFSQLQLIQKNMGTTVAIYSYRNSIHSLTEVERAMAIAGWYYLAMHATEYNCRYRMRRRSSFNYYSEGGS